MPVASITSHWLNGWGPAAVVEQQGIATGFYNPLPPHRGPLPTPQPRVEIIDLLDGKVAVTFPDWDSLVLFLLDADWDRTELYATVRIT